jgi:hypothetical protein
MLKTSILALCAALCAGAAAAHEYDYERGDPRAPGGWERGSGYEYGDPRGDSYSAGHRYERRSEYDSGWVGGDRYGAVGDRYDGGGHDDRAYFAPRPRTYSLPTYGGAMQAYGYPCGCARGYARGGEVVVPSAFFYDTGGVGPIPDGGYYGGGGYVVAGAGAGASASASAYASSRSSVSVRVGGFRGGHGGKGCCHGGKGK